MCKKDDIYIKILKYGKKNLIQGISYTNIQTLLEKQGYKFDKYKEKRFLERIFNDIFFLPEGGRVYEHNQDQICKMQTEAYFKLLEYEELKSARSASFWATVFAIIAIFIAAGSMIYEIFFTKTTEIIIQKEQMAEIQDIKIKIDSLESKLQEIIEKI